MIDTGKVDTFALRIVIIVVCSVIGVGVAVFLIRKFSRKSVAANAGKGNSTQ